ncbi:MAG: MarR family transcriptional regulator [Sphingomonadales bacterium]|nr:MarR family transcriptional regulator [Sphingomonadales bacterium]MDE2568441.1 MarR family transcriptional regulator [Sphingomonadales bacterium]
MKHDILMMNLLSAVYWFDEALQAKLEAGGYPGISRTQSLLLANIAAGEHRAIRIASNLGVSRQAISQILADMEARNIVSVSADPDDKRARIVDFHPSTGDLRKIAAAILGELEATVAERIGKARFQTMREALASDWGEPPRP